jgi:23S rRNA pseudouridine2605 synthase
VFDLVPPRLRSNLIPVGRLDFDTEGLLILTDDGVFANKVAHPRFGCSKTYEVKIKGRPSEDNLKRLKQGMVIDGHRTTPARVRPLKRRMGGRHSEANSWWEVEIQEGRTRQIREMFARVGFPVQRLRRVAIGSIRDPKIPKGSFRELTAAEIRGLVKAADSAGAARKSRQ